MKSNYGKTAVKLGSLFIVSGVLFGLFSQTLRGVVLNESGSGIEGATVRLTSANLSTVSGSDGTWSISVPLSAEPVQRNKRFPVPVVKGNSLFFVVNDKSNRVTISVFALNGRFLYNALNSKLEAGFYSLNPLNTILQPATYAIRVKIGTEISHFKMTVVNNSTLSGKSLQKDSDQSLKRSLQKKTLVLDTVRVSKQGYASAFMPISSYDDSLTFTLEAIVASYHLNPPHPCYNQFYVNGCIWGDPNSACGGNCAVANSCSPPEDPSKANMPKTFICPRFMLFSSEMLQAAKDDANEYGWGDEPPFNYGVVGHDPDSGGVDDGPSSCCQCYQIVYVNPEPSSPKPPELPYPKPLIVQSFNTAASGPKGFDVFMGAGGYGAFNSCYKDTNFPNTTKFDEFIYDKYPYQNPGSGGISFLRYPECIGNWPPTVEALQSSACQDIIRDLCNQALVSSSPLITEDTRRSCIQSNQVASLYHQNWEVMVKRVRCPENLTRVTGCRLIEDHLPLPSPEVQTPDDARANGTFREGYHTTTMQDCCKPTCAWANWVVDYKLPVDGEWNSFYSCDKNGNPFTR